MLPSNPRAGGLPGRPQPRSRSAGPSRRDAPRDSGRNSPQTSNPTYSHRLRPQQSIASLAPERHGSRAPPMPSSGLRQTHNAHAHSFDDRDRTASSPNRRSKESTSSAASSLLARGRAEHGYASSRTSFEDDDRAASYKGRSDNRGRTMNDDRNTRQGRDSTPMTQGMNTLKIQFPSLTDTPDNDDTSPNTDSGDGYAIWSRVAGVASTLTVSVSKAWASNIATYSGEGMCMSYCSSQCQQRDSSETPPGQESRLARAMKAYHIEKARDPTDLPSWLFSEQERRAPANKSHTPAHLGNDGYEDTERSSSEPPRSKGLRDIYADAAAATSPPRTRADRPPNRFADEAPQPSKATDRLRAMRDAKRGVNSTNTAPILDQPAVASDNLSRGSDPGDGATSRDRRAPRVGLPSGPMRPGRR